MTRSSTKPRRYPVTRPSKVPMTIEMPTAATATTIDRRAPWAMRLRMSRPSWSVPMRCAREGLWSPPRALVAAGSSGAIDGAHTARPSNRMRLDAPRANIGSRSSELTVAVTGAIAEHGGPLSLDADPRVEPAVREVHEQVQHDVSGGDDQDGAAQYRQVLVEDRADEEAADSL